MSSHESGRARRGVRGGGSRRERQPGVWEVRVTVGTNQAGRSVQRSFTVHGNEEVVRERQTQLVERFGVRRVAPVWTGERVSVGALLERFVDAVHGWSPTTTVSHAHMARALRRDALSRCWVDTLTPSMVHTAFARWADAGATVAMISGRFRVLHAAISWAVAERMLDGDPLVGMKAPPRPYPRKHLRPELVKQLITTAEQRRDKAAAAVEERPGAQGAVVRLFRAEQDVLLVRLAADAGLRRGELAALRTDDLDGRVLSVERALKGRIVGPTKTHQRGRLTLGATAARCWMDHITAWPGDSSASGVPGPWLFTAQPNRVVPISPDALSHRFDRLSHAAGVPDACLHRLRHTVGTVLVADGKILKAAGRLRHRDPSTTLRNYADALPLDDEDVADVLDQLYRPHSEPE